ncbi:hypothetical protein DFH09DRAFT_1091940 [Mycena vulgaris]|nr:hypothetical protein DFH09DRAFT_1091940 [Mycena vulgaris]
MHFTFLIKALGIVVLGSIFTAHAYESSPYPAVLNDIKCLKGSSTANSYTYNGPLAKFTKITQSFFHVAWHAGAPAKKTTVADNIPGATRADILGGGAYNETLTAHVAHPGALAYTVLGAPWTYTALQKRPLHFATYVEMLRLESICGGKVTSTDLLTYLCSDDKTAAYDLWYNSHMTVFPALATKVGTVLPGDCPCA